MIRKHPLTSNDYFIQLHGEFDTTAHGAAPETLDPVSCSLRFRFTGAHGFGVCAVWSEFTTKQRPHLAALTRISQKVS